MGYARPERRTTMADSTRKPSGRLARPPTLSATRVEVSFFAEGSLSHWREIAEQLGMSAAETETSDSVFSALPASPAAGEFYLVGGFHPSSAVPAESKHVHWHLDWSPMPSDPPPSKVVTSSIAVGGYPRVLGRLCELWPACSNVEMSFTVRFSRAPGRPPGATLERVALGGKFTGPISVDLPKILEEVAWNGLIQATNS
jgi:hypothetical protein